MYYAVLERELSPVSKSRYLGPPTLMLARPLSTCFDPPALVDVLNLLSYCTYKVLYVQGCTPDSTQNSSLRSDGGRPEQCKVEKFSVCQVEIHSRNFSQRLPPSKRLAICTRAYIATLAWKIRSDLCIHCRQLSEYKLPCFSLYNRIVYWPLRF